MVLDEPANSVLLVFRSHLPECTTKILCVFEAEQRVRRLIGVIYASARWTNAMHACYAAAATQLSYASARIV